MAFDYELVDGLLRPPGGPSHAFPSKDLVGDAGLVAVSRVVLVYAGSYSIALGLESTRRGQKNAEWQGVKHRWTLSTAGKAKLRGPRIERPRDHQSLRNTR